MDDADDMGDIIADFLVESYENLDQLDRDLVALETDPGSRDLLSSIFRTVHTIKGTSGFLGLGRLQHLAHTGENLLAELRDGARVMDRRTADALLMLVDRIREMLASIERGAGDSVDDADAITAIEAIRATDPNASGASDGSGVPAASAPQADADPSAPEPSSSTTVRGADADAPSASIEAAPPSTGETPSSASVPAPDSASASVPAPPTPAAPTPEPGNAPAHGVADTTIRVNVSLLDLLLREVGELILVRNQIDRASTSLADAADEDSAALIRSVQSLKVIADGLQEGVMKVRMQPIDHVWSKMPRLVRDVSHSLGREVDLVMEGRDTELDRSLLEALGDPLTHLVRNAIDHGIEPPAAREAAGKARRGTVRLRALHVGGQVIVEVSDDGAGIDPAAIGRVAVDRGLRTSEQVRDLTLQQARDLLFEPGFSTSRTVTNVSGRGVGMDVVRSSIESIGGSVDLESTRGCGTTWRMRLPLTLAIMPALTVRCASEVFALAQVNLLELVALGAPDRPGGVEHVGKAPVYRLRGALLPLVRLSDVLGLEACDQGSGGEDRQGIIAVLQVDGRRFGVVVDQVLSSEEIVVKSLPGRLAGVGPYSGSTVMGDGSISLILDAQALARRVFAGDALRTAAEQAGAAGEDAAADAWAGQLLVVTAGDGRRAALDLDAVERLEHLSASLVEDVGSHESIQYRGDLLDVVRLDDVMGAGEPAPEEDFDVVIAEAAGQRLALVVGGIEDTARYTREDLEESRSPYAGATVVVEGRATEILDLAVIAGRTGVSQNGRGGRGPLASLAVAEA